MTLAAKHQRSQDGGRSRQDRHVRWKGDILYGCNISGTVLSVGVCIYPASQPALVSGIAYGFSECVGVGIGLVYLFVVFSILIAFMAPASGFRRFMKLLSNYWLGVLMYTLMTLGIADGLRAVTEISS